MDGMVPNTATTMRDEGRRRRGRRTRRPRPPREDGSDSGADVVARVGRRDDRAATIDVVVVVVIEGMVPNAAKRMRDLVFGLSRVT